MTTGDDVEIAGYGGTTDEDGAHPRGHSERTVKGKGEETDEGLGKMRESAPESEEDEEGEGKWFILRKQHEGPRGKPLTRRKQRGTG